MRVIINKIIPFGKGFYAINLCGVLFAKGPCSKVTLNHEKIHTAQIKEMGYVGFYVAYVAEWLVRVVQHGGWMQGYLNVSFEREAYANQHDVDYLLRRRHYSFLKYMKTPPRP